MIKFIVALCAIQLSSGFTFAEEPSFPRLITGDFSLSQDSIGKIQVEAISHALVDLKLQEVALQRAAAPDPEKLGLVHAQQVALRDEIVRITIVTLEDDERRLSERYLPEHPRMKALRAEIELRKAELQKTS